MAIEQPKKRYVYSRTPAHELVDVPESVWQMAKKRTAHILTLSMIRDPLDALLASAYLQGIEDAMETVEYMSSTRKTV